MRFSNARVAQRRSSQPRCSSNRLAYKHGYHAGNAADILKHTVLVCLMHHMRLKAKPFIYVDTHAGAGVYDLGSDEAVTLREYDSGISLLARAASADDVVLPVAISTLLSIVDEERRGYPGSPLVARALCRPGDSLFLCERAELEHERLVKAVGDAPQVTALCTDGYKALTNRQTCPQAGKSRALVLVDPPYQYGSDTDQIVRLVQHLGTHWRSARVAIWYPITRDVARNDRLHAEVRAASEFECLAVEMRSRSGGEGVEGSDGGLGDGGMLGSGMLLVQPPYGIEAQLVDELLPVLGSALNQEGQVTHL